MINSMQDFFFQISASIGNSDICNKPTIHRDDPFFFAKNWGAKYKTQISSTQDSNATRLIGFGNKDEILLFSLFGKCATRTIKLWGNRIMLCMCVPGNFIHNAKTHPLRLLYTFFWGQLPFLFLVKNVAWFRQKYVHDISSIYYSWIYH